MVQLILGLKSTIMRSVEIIMLPVKDRQKAKEFYLSLGFQVVVEAPDMHGSTWIQMGLPGEGATLSLSGFHGVICETADIEAEIRELSAKGVKVGKVDDTPWGRFAWLQDLDGNELCLHQAGGDAAIDEVFASRDV
jgi:catechol 2,3-dioxygenase-like lactoylglutathione lyase family enzyme